MAFATLTRLTLCALWLGVPNLPAAAQSAGVSVGIVLDAGRPLRVSLDQRLTIKRVGQIIEATVLEPAYAHDRVVVPAGTQVRGRVASFEDVSKLTRARAMLNGSFTPLGRPVLEFHTLILSDGRELEMQTVVSGGCPTIRRSSAGEPCSTRR